MRVKTLLIIILSLFAVSVYANHHHHNKHHKKQLKLASNHQSKQHNKKDGDKKSFNNKQKKEIEQIIHNYLITKPEVLIEASRSLQQKQKAEMMEKAKEAIALNRRTIFKGASPVAGNPDGVVSLVEFFDYQCKHCKNMTKIVDGLIDDNKDLRVIYKELPIFGADSEFASKAALAAKKQNKYSALHDALMDFPERLSEDKVFELAKQAGLDVEQLKKDMDDPAIASELRTNMVLAQKIGIMGTPAFIVAAHTDGDNIRTYFVAGASSKPMLQSLINKMKQ